MSTDLAMPWGKYRGHRIEDLPSGYLQWLAENCNNDEICEAADEEYRWREDHHEHTEDGPL